MGGSCNLYNNKHGCLLARSPASLGTSETKERAPEGRSFFFKCIHTYPKEQMALDVRGLEIFGESCS